MYIFLSILTILTALVLILVVLVQNSKGGGLSSNFSSSNQIMGAPKTADFLEKLTWSLIGVVIVLSLATAKILNNENKAQQTNQEIAAPIENTQAPDVSNQPVAQPQGETTNQSTSGTQQLPPIE